MEWHGTTAGGGAAHACVVGSACSLTHLGVRSLACSPPPSPGAPGRPVRGSLSVPFAGHVGICVGRADKPVIRVVGHHRGLALLPPVIPSAGGGQPHGGGTMAALDRTGGGGAGCRR